MVKEGYIFGLPPLAFGIAAFISRSSAGLIGGSILCLLALFVFYFFRNPLRSIPAEP